MVSQSLNFDAGFEGILGLGVPNVTARIGPAGGHRQEFVKSRPSRRFLNIAVFCCAKQLSTAATLI